jgi:hypothetical protein
MSFKENHKQNRLIRCSFLQDIILMFLWKKLAKPREVSGHRLFSSNLPERREQVHSHGVRRWLAIADLTLFHEHYYTLHITSHNMK